MVFTMACPNFKKVLKMAFGPLGVKKSNVNDDRLCNPKEFYQRTRHGQQHKGLDILAKKPS
jgi:hypothetical protein